MKIYATDKTGFLFIGTLDILIADSNQCVETQYIIFCDLPCYIVSWEPEGHYCNSKMFRWEPEGRYRHTLCTAIAPFWFSTEHLCIAIAPFWFSTEHLWIARVPFWFSTEHLWIAIAPFWLSTDDIVMCSCNMLPCHGHLIVRLGLGFIKLLFVCDL